MTPAEIPSIVTSLFPFMPRLLGSSTLSADKNSLWPQILLYAVALLSVHCIAFLRFFNPYFYSSIVYATEFKFMSRGITITNYFIKNLHVSFHLILNF